MPYKSAKLRARAVMTRAVAQSTRDPELSDFLQELAEQFDEEASQRRHGQPD